MGILEMPHPDGALVFELEIAAKQGSPDAPFHLSKTIAVEQSGQGGSGVQVETDILIVEGPLPRRG